MSQTRFTKEDLEDLRKFMHVSTDAWMQDRLIRVNSFAIVVLIASRPGSDFEGASQFVIGRTLQDAEHDQLWYITNADGKNAICLETGMDSHEAVRVWQGLVSQIDGAFPWGGAIIDPNYGLIIGTSGFKEDEDIFVSRTARNRLVMMCDRGGDSVINDARERGEQPMPDGADRFTTALRQ